MEVVSQFRPGPRDAFIKAELGWAGQSNRISRYSETPVPWPLHEAVETQLNTLNSNIVQLCFQFGRNMGLLYLLYGCNGNEIYGFRHRNGPGATPALPVLASGTLARRRCAGRASPWALIPTLEVKSWRFLCIFKHLKAFSSIFKQLQTS